MCYKLNYPNFLNSQVQIFAPDDVVYLLSLLFCLQTQDIAIRCIQKNVRKFMGVRGWPWWRLLIKVTADTKTTFWYVVTIEEVLI